MALSYGPRDLPRSKNIGLFAHLLPNRYTLCGGGTLHPRGGTLRSSQCNGHGDDLEAIYNDDYGLYSRNCVDSRVESSTCQPGQAHAELVFDFPKSDLPVRSFPTNDHLLRIGVRCVIFIVSLPVDDSVSEHAEFRL